MHKACQAIHYNLHWFSIICRPQPFNVAIIIASSYTHPHFDYFNHVLFNLPSTRVLPIHNIKSLSNYLLFTNGIQSLKFRNSLNLGSLILSIISSYKLYINTAYNRNPILLNQYWFTLWYKVLYYVDVIVKIISPTL